MNKKIAHLGFVQTIISRMATNSFLLKGWSVTLVAAIFALSSKDSDKRYVIIAYLPIIVFWIYDAFFFQKEKLYRKLYKKISVGEVNSDEFTLDLSDSDINADNIISLMFSKAILFFYFSLFFIKNID